MLSPYRIPPNSPKGRQKTSNADLNRPQMTSIDLKRPQLTSIEPTTEAVVKSTNKPFKNRNKITPKVGASPADNIEFHDKYLKKLSKMNNSGRLNGTSNAKYL